MTDCLTARINSPMNRSEKKNYSNFLAALAEVESIFETVKDYNKTLKFPLRNMIYFFRTGVCGLFVLMSLDMDIYVETLTTFPALSGVCVTVMIGLYISGARNMLSSLYKEFNTCYVRSIQGS